MRDQERHAKQEREELERGKLRKAIREKYAIEDCKAIEVNC